MEKLINKNNNIERNVGWVERQYWLGARSWFVGKERLFVDGNIANEAEIKEFLRLKRHLEGE